MSKKIYLDPGHGNNDPGAVGNGYKEAVLALEACNYIAPRLRELGFSVTQSRTTDSIAYGPNTVYERGLPAAGHDFYFTFHFNAGGGTGGEAYPNARRAYGPVEARIRDYVGGILGWRKIGGRNYNYPYSFYAREAGAAPAYPLSNVVDQLDYYGYLRGSYAKGVPGCLLETCFIDTKADMDKYIANKQAVWEAVVQALCEGLGGTYSKPGSASAEDGGEDDLYAYEVFNGSKINVQGFSAADVDKVTVNNIPNGVYQVYESGMALANSTLKGALIRYNGKRIYVPLRADAARLKSITVAEAEAAWSWYAAPAPDTDHSACAAQLAAQTARADAAEKDKSAALAKFDNADRTLHDIREVTGDVE